MLWQWAESLRVSQSSVVLKLYLRITISLAVENITNWTNVNILSRQISDIRICQPTIERCSILSHKTYRWHGIFLLNEEKAYLTG